MQENKNLSVEEVAQWLEVNAKTVYRLVQKGQIPGFKVGGQWRFNEAMLKDWLADRVMMARLKAENEENA